MQTVVEGRFRESRAAAIWIMVMALTIVLGAAIGVVWWIHFWWAAGAAVVIIALAVVVFAGSRLRPATLVRLTVGDNSRLEIRGPRHNVALACPFFYVAGVDTIGHGKAGPMKYIRMSVTTQDGTPLLLEELVPPNVAPPALPAVPPDAPRTSADLSSATPYPGPLWRMIEALRS